MILTVVIVKFIRGNEKRYLNFSDEDSHGGQLFNGLGKMRQTGKKYRRGLNTNEKLSYGTLQCLLLVL